MTSEVNIMDLTQKIALLKELHAAFEGGADNRDRYIEVRREVSNILLPVFDELIALDMLSLRTPATNTQIASIESLNVVYENSGITLEKVSTRIDF